MRNYSNYKKSMTLIGVLMIIFGFIVGGIWFYENKIYSQTIEESAYTSKTITRNGVNYFPRQDITVILAMGIDELGPVQSSGYYRNNGESDAIFLLVLDQTAEKYSVLCLNRDTMVEMPVLGLGGKNAGTFFGQLALSHTYGEGLQDSCENTRDTVSNLLGGITIDHYVALNMDAIAVINDAVGGVTVNVTDDFSDIDSAITMGEYTLKGQQALTFVQTRKDLGNQLNISRMDRHEEYLKGFMEAFSTKLDSDNLFAIGLYDDVSSYMVTDCSATVISGLMERCSDYTLEKVISPEGENILAEYYEFYVDEEKLDQIIVETFYAEKK